MDPITLIVTAAALGAAAGIKATAEQAIRDAYSGLKALITRKYSSISLAQLEESPDSQARRAVVQEDLSKAGAGSDEELLRQAKKIMDAIQAHAPETAASIGVDLQDIKAASLNIEDIIATATGVRISKGEFTGEVSIRQVRAGSGDEEPPKA